MKLRLSPRAGFGLLEVVFAITITVTALLALQAVVSGGILSVANSINRRAARELCRTKLEEILAGLESPSGGGDVEERSGFSWRASTEDVFVGAPENQSETVTVVTVEVTFPMDSNQDGAGLADEGEDTIRLSAALPPDPNAQAAAPPPPQ